MDKELQDGVEQEDTWPGEGEEVLARNLLVDGETGESFPAQVLPPLLTPGNFSLEKAVVSCGMDLTVYFGLGSLTVSGLRKEERMNRSRGARHLADSCLHQASFTFPVLPWSLGLRVSH